MILKKYKPNLEGQFMQQIMWETTFNKQFEELLDSYGIDKTNVPKIIALKNKLNITRRASCQLIVEIDEEWKDRLKKILENEELCCK
jgi:hypothetical protein